MHIARICGLRLVLVLSLGVLIVDIGFLKVHQTKAQTTTDERRVSYIHVQCGQAHDLETHFSQRLEKAEEVCDTFYCRGASVVQLNRHVVWVSRSPAPPVTRDELLTGDALHKALHEGPLNVVGTLCVQLAPSSRVRKGDLVKLFEDADGLLAVSTP